MTVEPETAAAKREYEGKTYHFCSPGCAKAFDLQPEAFASTTCSNPVEEVIARGGHYSNIPETNSAL